MSVLIYAFTFTAIRVEGTSDLLRMVADHRCVHEESPLHGINTYVIFTRQETTEKCEKITSTFDE